MDSVSVVVISSLAEIGSMDTECVVGTLVRGGVTVSLDKVTLAVTCVCVVKSVAFFVIDRWVVSTKHASICTSIGSV